MATENVKLKVDVETGQAAKSLSDLKKEFRDLQTQLSNTKVGTKEYADTLKKLGETKDDIGDLRGQIDALGSNAAKFKAIGNVVQGVAGGFAAASSAAALFGGEAEEVQKAMLKVQAALALQQGISAVLELGDAFKALKVILLANPIFIIATVLATIIGYFVGLENIIGGVKAGFKALGEAASSVFDGIVDGILYAIDLYTQYLDLVTFGLLDINEAYNDYRQSIEDANKAEAERLAQQKKIVDEAKKLGDAYIAAADALEKREASVVKAYNKEIELLKAAGKNTEEIEIEKLEFVRGSLEDQIKLRKLALVEELKILEATQGEIFNIDNIAAKVKAEKQRESLKQLEKSLEDTNDAIDLDEARRQGERNEKAKEAYAEKLKADEEYLKNKKELDELYAEEDRKQREKAGKEYLEYLKTLGEEEVIINTDVLDQVMANNEKGAEVDGETITKQLALEKLSAQKRIELATGTLNTLSSLTELFGKNNEANAKKAFQVNKALAISSALIQTYQAVTGALTAGGNPIKLATGAQFIEAGIALTAGLANVAKIAQTQFQSNAGGGGGGSSTPSVPSINAPSSQGGNSIGTTLLNRQAIEQGQQPTENRVYVVESDMTSTQRRVGGIRNRATVVE